MQSGSARACSSSTSTFAVSIDSLPPAGMASRELITRFRITCSICPGSALTRPRLGLIPATSSMSSPMTRRNIRSSSATRWFRSTTIGWTTWLRAKARSWLVSSAARFSGQENFRSALDERRIRGQIVEHPMAVAGDHGQQIVEVMRNTPGEPSDGFHLMRLQQVRLEAPPLADVPCDALDRDRLPHLENQARARFHGYANTLLRNKLQLIDGLGLAADLAVQHLPA